MQPHSMSRDMIAILQQAAGVLPPPGNAVVVAVLSIVTIGVWIYDNKKADPETFRMLEDLCDLACIVSNLVPRRFEELRCENAILELLAKRWERTLKDLEEFMTEIRDCKSRIFRSNEKVQVRCKELTDRINIQIQVVMLYGVTVSPKNQSHYPVNLSLLERSNESVCSSSITAAGINDIVKSWEDNDYISAAEVRAIVPSLLEHADAESIVEKLLHRLGSDATVADKMFVQTIILSLLSFQDQASKKVGETEPSVLINVDPCAHPLEVAGDAGKRARIKRSLKEKAEKFLLKHPHIQQWGTYAVEKFRLKRE